TPQGEDELVFGGAALPRRYIGAYLTEDERYLIISASVTTNGNELYLQDLTQVNSPIVQAVDNFTNNHWVIDNEGDKLFIQTDLNAPNGRLVVADANNSNPQYWTDLIGQTENVLNASAGGGKIFANY